MKKKLSRIKVMKVSAGMAEGEIIFFNPKKSKSRYNRKVVVIDDLDVSEIIPELRATKGIIASSGGITAHGAVLAREFKLPTAILPNAKKILQEKSRMFLDDKGFIFVKTGEIKTKNFNLKKEIPKQEIRKGKWVLVKAGGERLKESRFLDDFGEPGSLATAKMVLDKKIKKIEIKRDKYGIWATNHPLPSETVEKILKEPKWFWQKVREQKKIYMKFKKYVRQLATKIKKGINYQEAFKELKKSKDWVTKIKPYIYLFAYCIDIMEKNFYKMANSFLPPPLAIEIFDEIGQSSYSKKIFKKGIKRPRVTKRIYFPPSPIKIIQTQPNYGRQIRLDKKVVALLNKQPKFFQKKFKTYLEILPTMVEVNEEICYASRTFFSALVPRLMLKIAKFFISKNIIKEKKEVFNYTIEEMEKILSSLKNQAVKFHDREI